MKISVFCLAILLAVPGAAAANSKLTVCNQSEYYTLKITMLYHNHILAPLADSWKVYGWMKVEPGRCQPLVQHPGQLRVFLSVRESRRSGDAHIMHFPFGREGSETQAAERFFCVRDEPFDRVLPTLHAHESCPQGWYSQLFNLYVKVPRGSNYTLQLGK